jgi:arabinogalactan oligomer/maltooligosaccharide transport system permease protein
LGFGRARSETIKTFPPSRLPVKKLLLALLLAPAVAEAQTEIVLWHAYNGAERDALIQAVDAFHAAHPGTRVTMSGVPHEAITDKLTVAIPRGHGPDVFIYAHDRIGGWAEGGQIAPLELMVTEEMLDRHETACVFALAYGPSLYGLPLAYKALALYVRTDLVPEPPRDFASLLATAKKHTDQKSARYGLVYNNVDLFFHLPLIHSYGGWVFEGADPTQGISGTVDVANEGVARSLAMARRLAKEERIVPDDPTQVTASAMFSEGRTPMLISGPWFRSEIPKSIPDTVVPIPAFEGGKQASGFSTCEGIMLSSRSKHPKEAFAFMRYLAEEGAPLRMKIGGQAVTLKSAWETSIPENERSIFEGFREAFLHSVPSPSDPRMAAVWTPMNGALYNAIHQGVDPAEAAREAQRRIDVALNAAR